MLVWNGFQTNITRFCWSETPLCWSGTAFQTNIYVGLKRPYVGLKRLDVGLEGRYVGRNQGRSSKFEDRRSKIEVGSSKVEFRSEFQRLKLEVRRFGVLPRARRRVGRLRAYITTISKNASGNTHMATAKRSHSTNACDWQLFHDLRSTTTMMARGCPHK